jgi:DNA-binding XRE family transcriptional regulator
MKTKGPGKSPRPAGSKERAVVDPTAHNTPRLHYLSRLFPPAEERVATRNIFLNSSSGSLPSRFAPPGSQHRMRGFDITQAEFAERIGVAQSYPSALERGETEPCAGVLISISREIGNRLIGY